MSDAVATAETMGELGPLVPELRDGGAAQLTMIPGDADDELRHLIYEAGAGLSDTIEVSPAIRDHLTELKNRHHATQVTCLADYRSRLAEIEATEHEGRNVSALGHFSMTDIVIVRVLDETTLRIGDSEHEIVNSDERLMWNLVLNNGPLLARDFTTNPMFGSLQGDLEQRKTNFGDVLDDLNGRADRPLVLGHGNKKGRRYGLEPHVMVSPHVEDPELLEAAQSVIRLYSPDSLFVRSFLHLTGLTTEQAAPTTLLEAKDVRKALSEIASRGLAEDFPDVRRRFREYLGQPAEEGEDKPKKKPAGSPKTGGNSALADIIYEASRQRAGWIGKAECRDTDPERFHLEGGVGREATADFAGRAEALIGTWCMNCKARSECLEYAQNMDVKGLKYAGIRVYGGKVFGTTAAQKRNLTKGGWGDLIGEQTTAPITG